MRLISHESPAIPVIKQCNLLKVTRSRVYYKKKPASEQDEQAKQKILEIYAQRPFYGYRRINKQLAREGIQQNLKKTRRLMRLAHLAAVGPVKSTTSVNKEHKKYPYLLKGLTIDRPNQVWEVDITYIKISSGFAYLTCLIDVASRKIMGWKLSPFLDTASSLEALHAALKLAMPGIINSDQGCQFTSDEWVTTLKTSGIQISMDGKGRWADNIYIERLWRTVKYECVFLNSFCTFKELQEGIREYITFYNTKRLHQSLGYNTPDEVYFSEMAYCVTERLDLPPPGNLYSQEQLSFLS